MDEPSAANAMTAAKKNEVRILIAFLHSVGNPSLQVARKGSSFRPPERFRFAPWLSHQGHVRRCNEHLVERASGLLLQTATARPFSPAARNPHEDRSIPLSAEPRDNARHRERVDKNPSRTNPRNQLGFLRCRTRGFELTRTEKIQSAADSRLRKRRPRLRPNRGAQSESGPPQFRLR